MPIRPRSPSRSTSRPEGLAIEVVNVNEPTPGSGCAQATNFRPRSCVKLSLPVSNTLAQKLWDTHVVHAAEGEPDLLFVDLHLVHEVTSPHAFEALRLAGRKVRRPDLSVATMDHNTPTSGGRGAADEVGKRQLDALEDN